MNSIYMSNLQISFLAMHAVTQQSAFSVEMQWFRRIFIPIAQALVKLRSFWQPINPLHKIITGYNYNHDIYYINLISVALSNYLKCMYLDLIEAGGMRLMAVAQIYLKYAYLQAILLQQFASFNFFSIITCMDVHAVNLLQLQLG